MSMNGSRDRVVCSEAIPERMSGNEAVAYAIRQVNPDVMPAFPITPSTEIPQMVSAYIANGEIDTEFIPVESEHSAMSAAIGAEAAGARTMTATSSAGLALMWEELLLAASNRLPIVLTLVNRTLSGPININCDHSDGMGARDTGWIQIYAENNQEAYDNYIQAFPIAEDPRVHLPVMICQDGFITSHAVENIELLEDAPVKAFVGDYEPEEFLLNPGKPVAVGPYSVSAYAMEAKRAQEAAMERAGGVILEVAERFAEMSGRKYSFFEEYRTEDAEYLMVIMGSAAGTAKAAVDTCSAKKDTKSESLSFACSGLSPRRRSLRRSAGAAARQWRSWTAARATTDAADRSEARSRQACTGTRSWSTQSTIFTALRAEISLWTTSGTSLRNWRKWRRASKKRRITNTSGSESDRTQSAVQI